MAEQPFRLTTEEVATLREAQTHINSARDVIKRLKSIGVPTVDLEERLQQAIAIRQGLLDHFAPTGRPKTE